MSDGRIEIDTSLDASNVKKSLEELEKTFDNASKQIAKSMTDAEKAMNKVKPNPQIANEFTKIGDSVTKTGEKISKMGSSLSTKVTLPVVGALTVATNAAAKFEHEMADIGKEVEAKGENVGQVIKEMSANSIKWSEDFGQSTADINKGLLILEKDGYSSAESMNIMNTALYTARGANEDLFTVIDQLGGSLEAYGQKTDNAAQTTANMSHMADTFAYISNHTKASISSLGEAFSTAGQTAAALGQPMEQTAAAIGILESSNIDASTAATSLKAGLVNLTKPTKNMKKAMQELGLQAFDSNGKMKDMSTIINDVNKGSKNMTDQQKQAAIAMLFGKESLASWNVLVAKGGDYLKNLADSAGNATGEVQHLSDSMKDTPVNKMKEAEASIKAMGIAFGEDVLPAITPLVKDITELFKGFANLDEGTKKEIIDLALMAAAAGPVLKVFGALEKGIGKVVSIGGKLGGLGKMFNGISAVGEVGGIAEAGAAAEGGTASLLALGSAGGVALAAIAALGAGVAIYATHQELMSKSVATSTDDLNIWEKAVNAITGSTVKSKKELQDLGIEYKDFGDNISDNFKNKVEESTKTLHEFEMFLGQMNLDGKINSSESSSFDTQVTKMVDDAISSINSKKEETNKSLSDLFKLDDDTIDATEQKVLDSISKGYDNQISQEQQLKSEILAIKQKAVDEKRALNDKEVQDIKDKTEKIKEIELDAAGGTKEEHDYAKNEFGARAESVSAKDAASLLTEKKKSLDEENVQIKASYDTQLDTLRQHLKDEQDAVANATTDEAKQKAQADADNTQAEIDKFSKLKDQKLKMTQDEWQEYINILKQKNPEALAMVNEFTGEMLSNEDKLSEGRLSKAKSTYTGLSNIVKSGTYELENTQTGSMESVTVSVDQATGKITGAYSDTAGKIGGYTDQMEKDNAELGQAHVRLAAECKTAMNNLGDAHVDASGKIISSSGHTVGALENITTASDGTIKGIYNLNGTPIEIETNADGTISNLADVISQILKIPKGTQTDIKINGEQINTVDKAKDKLDELGKENPETTIKINGEEVGKVEDAKKKLDEITASDPNATITVESSDADGKLDTTKEKADEVGNEQPNVDATANTSEADSNLDTTKQKAEEVPKEITTDVWIKDNVTQPLDGIINKMKYIAEHPVDAFVNMVTGGSSKQTNYTGTSYLRTGLSTVDEHGYETANNTNVKMLGSGMAFLMEHHYTGGDGINDHMTTVNEMHRDISGQVGDSVGRIVDKLASALGGQSTLLGQVVENTAATAKIGEKGNQLNEKLATDMVNTWSGKDGNFTTLENEIKTANDAKTKADKMKVEDNFWYSSSKSQLDDVEAQIDALKDKSQELSDNLSDNASKSEKKSAESEKKEIERQQHVLEKQKDTLQKSVDYYKDAAQKEIDTCKEQAEQEVKIAEEKKEKLTKVAEAVTTAIKNKLTQQKDVADKILNDELTKMETDYNNSVKALEDSTKAKTDKIDKEIKDLEKESTDTSRDDERKASKDNINALKTKMANTASEADKRAIALQIQDAQNELNKKEDSWDVEDKKAALEEEKNVLSKSEENQKKDLETKYNSSKKAKEKELKETDEYYNKLLETDAINAQARYMMLNGNNEALVALLNSYNPKWQDAGQSLADSLIDGLNSKKESVQDAIDDIMGYKNGDGATVKTGFVKSGTKYATASGFATGTNSNPVAGYYDTNENGFELKTSGDVAYVSKGAGIKNHMESLNYINNEIYRQVAMMQASVKQSNLDMMKSIAGMIAKSTNTSNNTSKVYSPTLHIDKYIQNTSQDTEQLANEFGVMAYRQRVD